LHVNNRAPLILAHHFGGLMRARGRGGMIFVSSTVAVVGVPLWSTYTASKAHDLVFAEGLARELRKEGVSVLALCPGPTRTELWPAGTRPLFPCLPGTIREDFGNAKCPTLSRSMASRPQPHPARSRPRRSTRYPHGLPAGRSSLSIGSGY
jgi:short-subunit dehydrogenase